MSEIWSASWLSIVAQSALLVEPGLPSILSKTIFPTNNRSVLHKRDFLVNKISAKFSIGKVSVNWMSGNKICKKCLLTKCLLTKRLLTKYLLIICPSTKCLLTKCLLNKNVCHINICQPNVCWTLFCRSNVSWPNVCQSKNCWPVHQTYIGARQMSDVKMSLDLFNQMSDD